MAILRNPDSGTTLAAFQSESPEYRLDERAPVDPLTGVANHSRFRVSLGQALNRARARGGRLALLHLDMDGFRRVNESFGYDAGDQMLRVMAARLRSCLGAADTVARVGADQFMVILETPQYLADIAAVADRLIDELGAPYELQQRSLVLPISIGIAVFPEAGTDFNSMISRAELAMADAKSVRGSQFRFYTEQMHRHANHRMSLEVELRRALRRNEFELFYQPRVELESGETVGVEALIRWWHPERGLLGPAEFIPMAEESGLIVPLGYWIVQQACMDLNQFDRLGHRNLDVAVNLSFRQLQDERFVETTTRLIRNSGIDPRRLEFELTETAIMSNAEQAYCSMRDLGQLGVSFSLDDFGTGYSSFAHIQRLPISALKIDRSFIHDVLENEDDAIIVKAIISLAHSLQLKVVAEGVETLEQVQFLWQFRCDQVQGFYFSPAARVPDLVRMLAERTTANL